MSIVIQKVRIDKEKGHGKESKGSRADNARQVSESNKFHSIAYFTILAFCHEGFVPDPSR